MGIDLLTAMMIQGNKTMINTYTNKEKKGYGFIVYLMKRGEIHTMLVSTLPNYPYSRKKEAKKAGDNLVEEVRKLDLTPQKSELENIIGKEEAKLVSEVVKKANE
jgi:hypothetical protein